jgi:hypothetical protein
MRYWIFWNDLVQGPFELDELVGLKAFSEDLPVCMEDRQDWLPASRVADLAPAVDLLRERRMAPPPPPPPPPPSRPPSITPLQGEFFSEPPGQQTLFPPNGHAEDLKGPFAYSPPAEPGTLAVDGPLPAVTMPIRFGARPVVVTGDVVAPPLPAKEVRPPVVVPPAAPPPLDIPETPTDVIDFPPPAPIEPPKVIRSPRFRRGEPAVRPAPKPEPAPELISEPIVEPAAPAVFEPLPAPPPPAFSETIFEEPAPPLVREVSSEPDRPSLIPWIFAAATLLVLLLAGTYWLFDRMTSRAAIAAVTPPKSVPKPKPVVQETPPAPAPVVALPLEKRRASEPPPVERTPLPKVKAKPVRVEPRKPMVSKPHAAPGAVAPKPKPVEAEAPKAVPVKAVVAETPAPSVNVDTWIGRQDEAIKLVMGKTLAGGKRTIGLHAKMMLDEMHEKELLHAAETGERLYLPDKINWLSLREDGPVYRVYLNFSAWRPSGERVQARSYQFRVDLQTHDVSSDDTGTRQDFLEITALGSFQHNVMADDIESILSAVDLLNKQKMHAMIVKEDRRNKREKKNREMALTVAQAKVRRAIVYFRTKYPEKALQNVAKAYVFTVLLKG